MKNPLFSSELSARASRRKSARAFTPLDLSAEVPSWREGEPVPADLVAANGQTEPNSALGPDAEPAHAIKLEVRAEETVRPPPEAEPKPQRPSLDVANAPPPGTIGAILVAAGRLSLADSQRVVAKQMESDSAFGETAIGLGLATTADVQFALSQQFALPCLRPEDGGVDPEVVAAFHPAHELVEHLRNLRGQIARRALDAMPPLRSIAVMGAERLVGRTYIAANLATVFAQLGARTLLVDADLVRPRHHSLFRLANRSGLSSILAGRADLDAACPVAGLPGLSVLPAGPTPPNPHDLIARPALGNFLRRCEQKFDVVLLDTPAWNEDRSARMVAAAAGAAVLLVKVGHTGASDAAQITQEIGNIGAKLLGVVINRP